jgi:hypothetical protein
VQLSGLAVPEEGEQAVYTITLGGKFRDRLRALAGIGFLLGQHRLGRQERGRKKYHAAMRKQFLNHSNLPDRQAGI